MKDATRTKSRLSAHQTAITGLMAALMCILGPLSIPIGAVPISFTNFAIYLAVYVAGTKLGLLSFCVYLLLGAAGLPIFSGFSGGLAKLAGPTGGYLVGFLAMALISGLFIAKSHGRPALSVFGMALGTIVAYLFGSVWFLLQAGCSLWHALTVCVFPFLIGDAVKILLAAKLGPMLRGALKKAGLKEAARQ